MAVPDRMIPLLQQFAVVGIVIGVAWLTSKWLDRRLDDELDRQQKRTDEAVSRADAEIGRVREDKKQSDRRNDAEIERLTRHYEGEIARPRKRIDSLEARLDKRDGG